MRINTDIDDDLMAKAMLATGLKTKKAVREHPINKVPMTSIKLPESRNNFREVTERFTSRKLFLLSGSSYQKLCLPQG
ncbi:MAG: type II toxin-antitoxin system VapB family antitoxin [Arcicella sp.]|nr:type II toxin-antitoxin system VapB family antitoxin [Arcicella sp.]